VTACPDINVKAVDVGSGNGLLRLEVSTTQPSGQDIVVVATSEASGNVLQTTVSRTGGLAQLTGPSPQQWYQITVSAFAGEGQRCDIRLRICF
jgi:hypothetical protein